MYSAKANVLNNSLGEYDCKIETQRCWGEFEQTVEHVFQLDNTLKTLPCS
jgi:hypothetical protein